MVRQTVFAALLALFLSPAISHAQVAVPAPSTPTTLLPLDLAPGSLACRLNLVRLWVSIPTDDRAAPWYRSFVGGLLREPVVPEDVRASRRACLATLDQPLVQFENDMPPSPSLPPTS